MFTLHSSALQSVASAETCNIWQLLFIGKSSRIGVTINVWFVSVLVTVVFFCFCYTIVGVLRAGLGSEIVHFCEILKRDI